MATMLTAVKTKLARIQPLRALFLREAHFQVRYDACHERGWTDSYLLTAGDVEVGYGSVKGREIADRDTVFKFFVVPPFRKHASTLFSQLRLVPWNRDASHNSRAGPPGSLRCSFLTYAQYARSSRLAIRAPRSGTYATHHGSMD
jgi:hypothetical protein